MLTLLFALHTAHADCGELYRSGAVQVRESANPKGKPTGKSITTVKSVTGSPDALIADVHTDSFDKKGKPTGAFDFNVTCKDGSMLMDMRNFWPADASEPYADYDMTLLANVLEYPANPVAGGALPEGQMAMKFTLKDTPEVMPVTMAMTVKDRVIVGPESVNTPARPFDAWKVTSVQKMVTTSIVNITVTMDVTEWYVPGLGVVKTSTSRKGKPLGTTTLIEIR